MTDREALAALVHDAWREGYTDGPASLEWIAAYLAERGVTLTPSLDEGHAQAFFARGFEEGRASLDEGLREANAKLRELLREIIEDYHQVGPVRDHADPKDKTGWNRHGIETCEDTYCLDALTTIAALRTGLREGETPHE